MDNLRSNLLRLEKLKRTEPQEAEEFLKKSKPHHIEFFQNTLHTFKEHAPKDIKPHLRRVLNSTSARMAKSRMLKAHKDTEGGFFDFLKKAGTAISNVAKQAGNTIVQTSKNVFDKAVPLAQKGFEAAKPLIKEHGPTLLGKAAEMIPIAGPIAGPIVKKGSQMLFNKLFG